MRKCIKCSKAKPLNEFYKHEKGSKYIRNICKQCCMLIRDEIFKREPWRNAYRHIRARCLDKKHHRYNRYGGRGIKNLLTLEEVKFLWKRDKADTLNKPSIDRINNDGNYELSNCRFIELSENIKRRFM